MGLRDILHWAFSKPGRPYDREQAARQQHDDMRPVQQRLKNRAKTDRATSSGQFPGTG